MATMKPTPHASFSSCGSYRPSCSGPFHGSRCCWAMVPERQAWAMTNGRMNRRTDKNVQTAIQTTTAAHAALRDAGCRGPRVRVVRDGRARYGDGDTHVLHEPPTGAGRGNRSVWPTGNAAEAAAGGRAKKTKHAAGTKRFQKNRRYNP